MLKTSEQVQTRLEAIIHIAEKKLAHACRDISGPGVIGTIGMLCESSHVGASINVDNIPKPKNLDMSEWLMTYPSTGFVLTTDRPQECIDLLGKHGLTANATGVILETRAIRVSYLGQAATFIDFEGGSIFGFKGYQTEENRAEKIEVKELSEVDASEIEELLKKVWSAACEYPKEWRKRRILTKEQISREMKEGCHYFGIRVDNKLAGLYKGQVMEVGLFGEHQTVDSDFRGLGLATAMYRQFVRFAKENNCKKVYVNILANQIASRKILKSMGFRRKGREYEQAKGMKVQMYERDV